MKAKFEIENRNAESSTYLHASGFVNIDLSATNTFEIVNAGLQPSFKMSKLTSPAEPTLQWYILVLKTTCKPEVKSLQEKKKEESNAARDKILVSEHLDESL